MSEFRNNNLSISDIWQYITNVPTIVWENWSISNSVKNGYSVSGWVYRSISIIARNAAQAPLVVYNNNDEIVWDHPLTILFNRPNKQFGHNILTQLIISWLNLAGEGYLYKNKIGTNTFELWPMSPDRLEPYLKNKIDLEIGYKEVLSSGGLRENPQYTSDTIIPIIFPDPSNPIRGIGPLQVAAKSVDTDTDQINWNKSSMQNRGVLDGVFLFDRDLSDENIFNLYLRKIRERFSGPDKGRGLGVMGSAAKYQQLSLSPVEMDFLNSRKFNREEIFIIFGVPPQLAGVTDAMTYNVYESSLKVLWESTIIPTLTIIADSMNNTFKNELQYGYYIGHDLSNIKALKKGEKEKAETAQIYYNMGVPVKILNTKLELGLEEYNGWDISKPVNQSNIPQQRSNEEFRALLTTDKQVKKDIKKRDRLVKTKMAVKFETLLDEQRNLIFKALDEGEDIQSILDSTKDTWRLEMEKMFKDVSKKFSKPEIKNG